MPHIGFNLTQEERFQENRRLGSHLLTIGWILLAMNGLPAMLMFQDIREGTKFWLVAGAFLGVIALALIAIGTIKRRQIPD
jgi:nitric oxide reductase large subunit